MMVIRATTNHGDDDDVQDDEEINRMKIMFKTFCALIKSPTYRNGTDKDEERVNV